MRKIIISLLLLSCEGSLNTDPYRSPCDQALDHIESCLGFRPRLIKCTIKNANEVLNTPCDEIRAMWE